ncbi:SAM-dependent methyltransferase [Bradyrhizobium sp. LA6.12]|uniref:SAM-dependent methyltransferase n=1 Tax=unclassified Bradyrhizobium TaxID=2631580 RepID=UPI003391C7CB
MRKSDMIALMAQNRSHAVMAQRTEASDSRDDFPTPPWATRALVNHVLNEFGPFERQSVLEPACGAGYMARPLSESFGEVLASDIHPYGFASVRDYLAVPYEANAVDWVITNPPFRLAEEFVLRSLIVARKGVAILARTVFIESVGRYKNLFLQHPPCRFAQFTERVPMVKGRVDRTASTATGYAWLVWSKEIRTENPALVWIPPCRKALERDSDYSVRL